MRKTIYAWCFDHGIMHRFHGGDEPWCTARWVAFTATTAEEAHAAKTKAYGDARFLHELPASKQLEVIEIGGARQNTR
ncbi:hypothetical protein [Streptomyces sp. STCH 565 A]|uniref:hypothetical protein n=1 Tax=Streptomyces sp. STCH 565 A TaxID=2950532 RepID=UPI002075327F|nr:hypothetical protein [Streptomyces sp. STCH 565 A]MCM8552309.1 hypothetical protein [Streptomyces sp. STCH 565 A]